MAAAAIVPLHAATAAEPLPAGKTDATSESKGELGRLFNAFKRRAATLPVLEGAAIGLDFDAPNDDADTSPRFVIHRIVDVDPARAAEQRAAMDRLIQEVTPPGRVRIDSAKDRTFPYSKLKAHLRDTIRTDRRFPGCELLGGTLTIDADSSALHFAPRFRVAREEQFAALAGVCRRYCGNNPETKDVIVDDAPSQRSLTPPDPNKDEVFRKLQEATRQEVTLHGAAIDVDDDVDPDPQVAEIAPPGYKITLTVDDARAAELSTAADKLARKLIPSGRFRFDTEKGRTLPVSDLLDRIQHEIDVDPRFAGCAVSHIGLGYSTDGDQLHVTVHGRILRPEQTELIATLTRRIMQKDPSWSAASAVVLTDGRDDLDVTTPSRPLAARYYGQAMNHFYASNFEEADKLLALASIEDPDNVVYRYWRVLGDMQQGDAASAEERLARTIRGFGIRPYSPGHVAAMRAIYRVQGSLRQELIEMENRVMAAGTRAVPATH